VKDKRTFEKNEGKASKRGKAKKAFVAPEIVEEKDFKGVIAVRFVQSLSNILPKTFRV
jgi:hypothetical protein